MKRTVPIAAAASAAAAAMFALPAGAAPVTRHPAHRPALCAHLPHVTTDGTRSLRYYARKMDAWPAQVLLLTGYCSPPRTHVTAAELRYHDFSKPFPKGVRLYGALFG